MDVQTIQSSSPTLVDQPGVVAGGARRRLINNPLGVDLCVAMRGLPISMLCGPSAQSSLPVPPGASSLSPATGPGAPVNPSVPVPVPSPSAAAAGGDLSTIGETVGNIVREGLREIVQALVTPLLDRFEQFLNKALESLAKPAPTGSAPETTPAGGASTPSPTPEPAAPTAGTPLAKSGKFLWKPVAEKDDKLVVLLPKELGRAKNVSILSPDGKTVLAKGRYSATANGGRAHYRFTKPGSSFPDGAIVRIEEKSGAVKQVTIPDTEKRFTY